MSAAPPPPPRLQSALLALCQEFPFLEFADTTVDTTVPDTFTWHYMGRVLPDTATPHPLCLCLAVSLPSQRDRLFLTGTTAGDASLPDNDAAPIWQLSMTLADTTLRLNNPSLQGYDNASGAPPAGVPAFIRLVTRSFLAHDPDEEKEEEEDTPGKALLRALQRQGIVSTDYLEARGFDNQRCCWCTAQLANGFCDRCRANVLCGDCFPAYQRLLTQWQVSPFRCPRCIYLEANRDD